MVVSRKRFRCAVCRTILHKDYIETLVEKGYKVAIAEQMEDPKQAKGMVRREVVQLITPGTMMEGKGPMLIKKTIISLRLQLFR